MHRPKRDLRPWAVFDRMRKRWKNQKTRHFSHKKGTEGRGRRK